MEPLFAPHVLQTTDWEMEPVKFVRTIAASVTWSTMNTMTTNIITGNSAALPVTEPEENSDRLEICSIADDRNKSMIFIHPTILSIFLGIYYFEKWMNIDFKWYSNIE